MRRRTRLREPEGKLDTTALKSAEDPFGSEAGGLAGLLILHRGVNYFCTGPGT